MTRKFKTLSVLAAGLTLALALGGCGGGSKSGGGDTVKLGGNLEMTGGSASYGISSKNAIELAIKQLNEKGGVNGKKLSLVVADNKSEATEATNAMQKLITQDKVAGVIGPNLSSAVIASTVVSGGAKTADIAPMATNPKVTVDDAGKVKPYNFRACFIDPFQGTVMARFALDTLHVKKAAIMIDNSSDYSKGLAQFFKEQFTKGGGTVVGEEVYLQKDTDFKATLTKLKSAGPDFLYIPGYYQEVGMIVKQAKELGLNVAMAGGDGWDSAKLAEIALPENLNNCYFSSLYSPDDDSALNKEFVAAYEKEYKAKPDVFAALSYDSTLLFAKAMETAKSTDPAKIAAALEKLDGFTGVSGPVKFDKDHNPIKAAVIIELKNGKQTFRTKVNP